MEWNPGTLAGVLANERHCGDVLARKTFTPNFLTHKSKKNNNDRTQYRQKNHHEAIVSREVFNAANHLRASRNYSKKNRPLPVLSVVEDGILRGYVPFDKDWTGFSAEEYREASESVMKEPDVTVTADVKKRLDLTGYEIVRVQYFSTMQNPAMTISNGRLRFNTACLKKFENVEYVELLLNSVERCIAIRPCDKNNLRDPAIVIRKDSITFNTACITGLEDVVYVHVMFNNDLKRIVVRGCDENDKDALRWCVAKPDKRKSRKMSCKPFATLVYQKMGWDSECRYKMLGYRITFEGETLYVFDLLVPEIFHEGQRKKNAVDSQDNAASTKPVNSRKGFYLDDIVGTFGVPVEEHRKESEVKQMDGYVSMGILTGKIAPEAGKD